MASLLEISGAQPQKQPMYRAVFLDRSFTGLFTQRAALHDPADIYTSKFYGGRPDALWAGLNIELSNNLTLVRRPGLSTFNTTGGAGFAYPTVPQTAYAFQLIDGTIRVMIDTGTSGPSEQDVLTAVAASVGGQAVYTGAFASGANNGLQGFNITIAGFVNGVNNGVFSVVASTSTTITVTNASAVNETHAGTATTLLITSAANASGGTTVYTGIFTGGGSNAFAGLKFTVVGFAAGVNNGTFVCTASTTTTLTLQNPIGVSETPGTPATVSTTGAVYWDKQNGTAVLIWAKSKGAGQTYFIGSGGILFFGNGVDTQKYTPFNNNGTVGNGTTGSGSVWNWGITAPTVPPTVNIVASGSATMKWVASSVYTTMGLTYDATNSQMWQLIGVNASPVSNPNGANATRGQAGQGGPPWNNTLQSGTTQTAYGTTPDNGHNWQNVAYIQQWQPLTLYGDAGINGTADNVCVYDPVTNAYYLNFKGGGALSASGNKKPPFTAVAGWNFTEQGSDGAAWGGHFAPHWFFFATAAQMQPWKASTGYQGWYSGGPHTPANAAVEPFLVPPPTTGVGGQPPTKTFLQVPLTTFTSSASFTPFPAAPHTGDQIVDNQLLWQCVSSTGAGTDALWHASQAFTPWTVSGGLFSAIFDGANIQVCVQATTNGALSGTIQPGTAIASAVSITVAANTPSSGQATYTLGAGSWTNTPNVGDLISISGFVNAGNNSGGSNPARMDVLSATNNTIVVSNPNAVNETHSATITLNPWGTIYGNTTKDGGLTWVCVGPSVAWSANSFWILPLTGFAPPQQTQQYGGVTIIGTSNQTVQTVISSGTSGTPTEPTWNTPGNNTTDNTVTWYAESFASANSLKFAKGYSYAYSYKARPLDDIYSAPPLGGLNGVQQIPPGDSAFLTTPPPGSQTNAISSASPATTLVGSNGGAVLFVSGAYSSDPQVDTIVIWRSLDGGGPAQMFELTEINNIVGGGTWTFQDFQPDLPVSTAEPGLNQLEPAPINGVNNPPLATFLPQVYNFERIWGADGQFVAFSGGPDTEVGNPDEAFKISDALPFLAPVTRVVKSAQGLVTFLTDSIEVIIGGPVTQSFSSVTWAPGIGLIDYNALDQFAGEIYFFSADNQFRVMTPSLNITNAGFAIGDQFANLPTSGAMSNGLSNQTWDPTQVYVANHQSATDSAIFVADGNIGWYRLNPRQAGALPNTEPVWSPFAQITNGCQMVMSIETSPGKKKLLVGPNFGGQQILVRDLTTRQDNGVSFDAFFEMGNIMLAHPGQLALLKFLEMDLSGVNFRPTVSYLLNEISGTFTPFTSAPVFDPPSLYGDTIKPTSYSPNRYYFMSNAALARCRHLRIKVDYGTNSATNELYNLTMYGRIMVEQ